MSEIYDRSLNETQCALETVYLYKFLYDYGSWETFREEFSEDVDDGYEIFAVEEALFMLSEAVWRNYSEYNGSETMYFSHPDMMEYYRLCHAYGKKHGVKPADNPYMRNAAAYVRKLLHQDGCYTCSYRLQTKVNHEWASGIVFSMWPEFNGQLVLLILMGRIFRFYTAELEKLKAETAVSLPKAPDDTTIIKKEAA